MLDGLDRVAQFSLSCLALEKRGVMLRRKKLFGGRRKRARKKKWSTDKGKDKERGRPPNNINYKKGAVKKSASRSIALFPCGVFCLRSNSPLEKKIVLQRLTFGASNKMRAHTKHRASNAISRD